MTTQISNHPSAVETNRSTAQETKGQSAFLRWVLYANAIFSTLCAALLLIDSGPVSRFMGWPLQWPLIIIGAGLLPFALFVFQSARRLPQSRRLVWAIFEMDLLWVIGSIIILLFSWPASTTVGGRWAIGIVAEIVALFAILEYIGLRRMKA